MSIIVETIVTNKYAGNCEYCSDWVPDYTGNAVLDTGHWSVVCDPCLKDKDIQVKPATSILPVGHSTTTPKRRGRPPGSKNKVHTIEPADPREVLLPVPQAPAPAPAAAAPTGAIDSLVRMIAAEVAGQAVNEDRVTEIVTGLLKNVERPRVDLTVVDAQSTRVIEGLHHKVLPHLVKMCAARLNCWLVGPAGTGKSYMGMQVATALDLPYYPMSFGPSTTKTDIFGYKDANGNYNTTGYRMAYEHGGVYLGDEIDNGHPGILAMLNQGIANDVCYFADGKVVPKNKNFVFMAAANTFGLGPNRQYIGRNIIDAATLDRFVTIDVDIDESLEEVLTFAELPDNDALASQWLALVRSWRKACEQHNIPLLITPRASIQGATLLRLGYTLDEAAQYRVWKGATTDTIRKVRGH